MDHHNHGLDWGLIACFAVSWALAGLVAWALLYKRNTACPEHKRCMIACLVKFGLMPPAMLLAGWWGMAIVTAAAGGVMYWPQIRKAVK